MAELRYLVLPSMGRKVEALVRHGLVVDQAAADTHPFWKHGWAEVQEEAHIHRSVRLASSPRSLVVVLVEEHTREELRLRKMAVAF